MSLVYSTHDSGLVVAEHGGDGAAVARLLKEHDRSLVLFPPGSIVNGSHRRHWSVYAKVGGDRPPVFVFAWIDAAGNALPISSRLVDALKEQDRNSRAPKTTEDEMNRRKIEREGEQFLKDGEAIGNYWTPHHGRPVLHRSQSLRMARDKQRAKGKKV